MFVCSPSRMTWNEMWWKTKTLWSSRDCFLLAFLTILPLKEFWNFFFRKAFISSSLPALCLSIVDIFHDESYGWSFEEIIIVDKTRKYLIKTLLACLLFEDDSSVKNVRTLRKFEKKFRVLSGMSICSWLNSFEPLF